MRRICLTILDGDRKQRGERLGSGCCETRAGRAAGPLVFAVVATNGGGDPSFGWFWALLGGTAVLLAAAVAVLLVLQRRQRRQMRTLLDRLERLEAQWVGVHRPEDAGMLAVAVPAVAGDGSDSITPSGDVLAGRTSYVRHLVESDGSTAQGLADQAIFRVHKHLEENVTPGEIADELYVSLRTLERGLAVALDCTPSQLILAMKMREARRMLKVDHLRVSEVAERLGFANPFHFSRRFKSFYRVSPSELRQEAVAGE
jgi:AraC-like DNA-binding protein